MRAASIGQAARIKAKGIVMWDWARRFGVKTVVFFFAVLSLTGLTYRLIGWWNAWRGNWGSVFYCYAGSRDFIDSYAPPGMVAIFRWRPVPIGVMRQDGRWGLVLASPVTERDFADPANAADFRRLQQRLGRIADLMGVDVINLAGILPSLLARKGVLKVNDSRAVVVAAVQAAVAEVKAAHFPDGLRDVIVLGGGGHVGRALCAALDGAGYTCHAVDPRGHATALPVALHGTPCLLIDIARKGAIRDYISQMWPGLVVLNEVFPCPSRRDVARMKAAGAQVFHLAGVAGRIIPPLPHGYENAVPCCASHSASVGAVRVIALG